MQQNEFKIFAGFILLLLFILIITIVFSGCDSGWSVAGWEIK